MAAAHGTPPVRKREIFGWAMYDFANSSYTTAIISIVYSKFFIAAIVPADSEWANTYWSLAMAASAVIALILSPVVGAACDYSGGKKRYLGLTTVICALATMGLWFAGPGDIWLAVTLVVVSNAAWMIGEAFCGSFLTELATKETMGKISGIGWGLGYMGGLLCLILLIPLTSDAADVGFERYVADHQLAALVIGGFFLLSSLPTFLLVKERSRPAPGFERASFAQLARVGLVELKQTYTLVRQYPVLFKFLIAFMIYMAGMEVVIKFVGIYANEVVRLTAGQLINLFLILQVSAALGALGFGYLEGRLGPKRTVMTTIVWWIGGILAIYFLFQIADALGTEPATVFYVIAIVAGSGMGSIQSSSRAVVGLLSPSARSAQVFGFWGLFGRLSVLVMMVYGLAADVIGLRNALVIVIGFFALGGLLLWRVPIDEGMRAAADADRLDRAEELARTGPV